MMLDTLKITDKQGTRLIAHQGLSGLETGNTCAAFIAAGNRSYYGIETDVHRTADGEFVVFHDDDTKRMTGVSLIVEKTDFATLRALPLYETRQHHMIGGTRCDLHMPTLAEYISICKQYGKIAVLELKNAFFKEDIARICDIIATADYLPQTVFISFSFENLVYLRELLPDQPVQFLSKEIDDETIAKLQEHHMDIDVYYHSVTAEKVQKCHAAGIRVNCWTPDALEEAQYLISCGVDFITSNILE